MRIRTAEAETYRDIWQVHGYAEYSPGETFVRYFRAMTQAAPGQSVLDAGCGSGKGALALQAEGFAVRLCDLTADGLAPHARALPFTPVCLWDDVRRAVGFADWVYCCDVLEHIPTPFTMLAVQRLLSVCRQGAFFSITLLPDNFGVWIGKPLHQTVQDFTQWRDQLSEVGTVVECRDLLDVGLYLVKPR
jgi:SAM-dependent methyltransferase